MSKRVPATKFGVVAETVEGRLEVGKLGMTESAELVDRVAAVGLTELTKSVDRSRRVGLTELPQSV